MNNSYNESGYNDDTVYEVNDKVNDRNNRKDRVMIGFI